MSNQQEIIKDINEIEELTEEEKNEFIKMAQNGEDPREIYDAIQDKLQKKLDTDFDKAGIELDENDPEYKAEYQKMVEGMESAKKEFDGEMEQIDTEANQVQAEAQEETDKLKIQEIQDSINNN
jgi:hypothetical protein